MRRTGPVNFGRPGFRGACSTGVAAAMKCGTFGASKASAAKPTKPAANHTARKIVIVYAPSVQTGSRRLFSSIQTVSTPCAFINQHSRPGPNSESILPQMSGYGMPVVRSSEIRLRISSALRDTLRLSGLRCRSLQRVATPCQALALRKLRCMRRKRFASASKIRVSSALEAGAYCLFSCRRCDS